MISIFQALSDLEATHQPAAHCTVVKASSSTPRHAASKMLVNNPELELQPQWGCNQQSCIVR